VKNKLSSLGRNVLNFAKIQKIHLGQIFYTNLSRDPSTKKIFFLIEEFSSQSTCSLFGKKHFLSIKRGFFQIVPFI